MFKPRRDVTACFTGHRIIPTARAVGISNALRQTVAELAGEGVTRFCAGGALGFDTLAALAVLETNGAQLTLVLPFRGQQERWPAADVAAYNDILSRANEVIYTSEGYYRGCYHARNRRLVEEASVCVCYYLGGPGGTAYTVGYAMQNDLKIINIAGG